VRAEEARRSKWQVPLIPDQVCNGSFCIQNERLHLLWVSNQSTIAIKTQVGPPSLEHDRAQFGRQLVCQPLCGNIFWHDRCCGGAVPDAGHREYDVSLIPDLPAVVGRTGLEPVTY
jgi:hypothetical protein